AGALVLVAACVGANQEPERVCTLIGCNNGLAVEVNSSLQQSVTVTVQAGAQVIHTFQCDPGQPCRAFVDNQTPDEVTVHVQTAQGTVSRTYRPEYKLNRPNGPDCPPECRQATVTVNVS
ncbi:MAG TPA: hypothetical protein VFZ04_10700, partial [Longimicrobiales bacterium]